MATVPEIKVRMGFERQGFLCRCPTCRKDAEKFGGACKEVSGYSQLDGRNVPQEYSSVGRQHTTWRKLQVTGEQIQV